jgi:ribosomal protein S18 acetylase RimI-like enzyme
MITITGASKKSVKAFNKKAWHGVDIEHCGRTVDWRGREFRFKALDGERIVGTISGKFESGILHIGALIVDKNERGKGIGKALLLKAEELGVKMGAGKVSLETGKDWEASNFYESMGYKKEPELPDYYYHTDFAVYSKTLTP